MRLRWTEHTVGMGETRNAYRILGGFSDNCYLEQNEMRVLYNTKMGLREVGCEIGGGWNYLRIVSSGGLGISNIETWVLLPEFAFYSWYTC
jgi:hypothetical protein